MTEKELWGLFIKKYHLPDCEYDAWAFGVDADQLAHLVVTGKKTATASAYPLYESEGEPLPEEGEYSVILDSRDEAVCIIRTTKVSVTPFDQVSEKHAFLEGEGNRTLDYWKSVHQDFFTEELQSAGMTFSPAAELVCEEFEVIYE